MHAELTHPRALIADGTRGGSLRTVAVVGLHASQSGLELLVDNVDTEIGVGVDIELRASTNRDRLEVVVAGRAGDSGKRSNGFSRAQLGVARGVIGRCGISAID